MTAIRVISRLDIKAPNLVKGIHLEGLRVLGSPADFSVRYSQEGADEIMYQDIVASLYGRNNILGLVSQTANDIYVPMSVGGGISSVDDVRSVLRSGGDKVTVNTAATKRPELIKEISQTFGSQCIIVAIETIRSKDGTWKVFTDNGREHTGLEALAWAEQAEALGAGEILLTSVDHEGTYKGYELDLIRQVVDRVSIPVIAHGGAGSSEDVIRVVSESGADAVAIAGLFHYQKCTIAEIKDALNNAGFEVRQ